MISECFPSVSVVFVDIVGFTEMSSSMQPEHIVKLLTTVTNAFDAVCEEHSLTKIKTIGDGYVAAAGPTLPNAFVNVDVVLCCFALCRVVFCFVFCLCRVVWRCIIVWRKPFVLLSPCCRTFGRRLRVPCRPPQLGMRLLVVSLGQARRGGGGGFPWPLLALPWWLHLCLPFPLWLLSAGYLGRWFLAVGRWLPAACLCLVAGGGCPPVASCRLPGCPAARLPGWLAGCCPVAAACGPLAPGWWPLPGGGCLVLDTCCPLPVGYLPPAAACCLVVAAC